ncbi:MAG: SDR family oxidoreductase [Pseudomonadota bacterium]
MNDTAPQRVLVTGAASGIGAAVAEKFAATGAKVHICDIDRSALDEFCSRHTSITGSQTDLSDPSAIASLFEDADKALGGLDVLVNNAGTSGPIGPADEISLEAWRACFAVNVDATFLCASHAYKRMKNNGGGSIINTASGIVLRAGEHRAPYAAAKWAVVGVTKSLAVDFAPANVRVNVVAPGAIDGDRIERVIRTEAEAANKSYDEMRQEIDNESALTGFSKASDVAEAVYWLSSSSASRVSGHLLPVDGYTL